jgi:pimeloyl-ACP methyl ester carboxylesterase
MQTEDKCGKSQAGWPDVSFIRVVANGINFEVATMGSGDRLALCLHGFPENAYSWRHQMPLLARLGYRVWAPNLRGYGATDSPREISAYQPHTLIEDVASLIKVANPKETLVIAHDLGAVLAWALAITSQSRKSGTLGTSGLEQPQLIDRLVILNLPHPACFAREVRKPIQLFKSWYMFFFQLPWLPEKILGRRQGRGASELIRKTSCNPARFRDEALEIYRANAARPGGLRAMLNWYRAAFRSSELRSIFSGKVPIIDIPTLFLWGDQDVALSLRTTRGTEQYVSDLTFRIFPGVSHWIQQEAPEAVNAMLEAWLTGKLVPEYNEVM